MKIQDTFLYRLYRTDKILLVGLVLYALGLMYHSLKSREEFPFLLYGMYSLPEQPKEIYVTYSVEMGETPVNYSALPDAKKELLTAPVRNAAGMDSLTAPQKQALQNWVVKLMIKNPETESKVGKPHIYKLTCSYNKQGKPEVLKKELLFTDEQ